MEAVSNSYVTEASLVHDLLLFDWGHSLITSEQLAHNYTHVKYMQEIYTSKVLNLNEI